ncbi:uncharacterized protein LOC130589877 [Beta vulgaris subsp. vulgaris]|uniref:uncharacterized protein LOC130589877 n=1 Tax=Beta vulgaris subsp. vulgaris TaxID=3555 RepID=UPI00254878F3|nr:uncharacterized protein LOC130589877 [Beta vulgaris subsp. vulgaris]
MGENVTRTFRDYAQPSHDNVPTGVRMPTIAATNFEIKSHVLNMVLNNQFAGLPSEDPNQHLHRFLQCCATQKQAGDDSIRTTEVDAWEAAFTCVELDGITTHEDERIKQALTTAPIIRSPD